MTSRRAWIVRAALLLGMSGLAGCGKRNPVYGDPFSVGPMVPPRLLYSTDWWLPLVEPPLFEYAPREPASPAFDPDTHRVIASTRDGYVRSIDPFGKVEWTFRTHGRFIASALVQGGVAYVPGGDGILYALRSVSGEQLWRYDAKEELVTTPVIAGGKVLVASGVDAVYAIDQKTGRWIWQHRRDFPSGFTIRGASRPTLNGDTAYVGFSDGHLVALKIEDGQVRWDRSLSSGGPFSDVDTAPVIDDAGRLFVASYKDGIYALDAGTGHTQWRAQVPGITSLVSAGQVIFAAGDEEVSAYLADGGRRLWSHPIKGRAGLRPLLVKDQLLVPISRGLFFLDPATGQRRASWDPGQGVSATPLWTGQRLYVLSNSGYLYSLRLHPYGD